MVLGQLKGKDVADEGHEKCTQSIQKQGGKKQQNVPNQRKNQGSGYTFSQQASPNQPGRLQKIPQQRGNK